jgi:hypothetical protein
MNGSCQKWCEGIIDNLPGGGNWRGKPARFRTLRLPEEFAFRDALIYREQTHLFKPPATDMPAQRSSITLMKSGLVGIFVCFRMSD